MNPGGRVRAHQRIAALASQRAVHAAFRWLHLHEPQVQSWQRELVQIPAPPFAEEARAHWFLERFAALGLSEPHLDAEGNVLAALHPAAGPSARCVLLSAHLDTVFPAGTDTTPHQDGARLLAPGACDNGAGLAALLGLAAALRTADLRPPSSLLFAANVGEEGAGVLRGMRYLLERGPLCGKIAAVLALEGAGTATAVDRGLGSVRLRLTVVGPGGHSWTDAAMPNPILILARALVLLADRIPSEMEPRTTFSPGQIEGGISVNAIPPSASVTLDIRSTDSDALRRHELEVHRTLEHLVADAARRVPAVRLLIERIGHRPAAALPMGSPMRESLLAVDRHLGLSTGFRLGSTDANLPLAHGIPALALAAGGTGGGLHTLAEWHDATGRETALRRILLLLLDVASSVDGWHG